MGTVRAEEKRRVSRPSQGFGPAREVYQRMVCHPAAQASGTKHGRRWREARLKRRAGNIWASHIEELSLIILRARGSH